MTQIISSIENKDKPRCLFCLGKDTALLPNGLCVLCSDEDEVEIFLTKDIEK